jgi:ApbE superfamily uncharacterized protein (UPF0280 family)
VHRVLDEKGIDEYPLRRLAQGANLQSAHKGRHRGCRAGIALETAHLFTGSRARYPRGRVRTWTTFRFKEADLRVSCPRADVVEAEVRRLRAELEAWIERQPAFKASLVPIDLLAGAPRIAVAMAHAARACGVGPLAAVAGAVAQAAAEAALAAGADEAIVENGGDTWIASPREVTVGLYAGENALSGRLALRIPPERLPLAVCSSSGRFGHSLSFGDCDLATVVAKIGALADAAATLAANCVRAVEDIEPTLERVMAIPGIGGVLIAKGDRVGVAGDLPPLVPCADADFALKTRHR